MNNNRCGNSRYGSAARKVAAGLLVALATLAVSTIASAQDAVNQFSYREPALVKFKGAIAVDPVANISVAGVVTLNIVRGVSPGGTWRIADLSAVVSQDGHISVVGRGLLLANGNGIATNANQSVHATLFCGSAATATAHDSTPAGVALAADGDFRINDVLSPAPPSQCDSPVLLIRNAGGVWFAAGIPFTTR
jgi:hypothetical protein